MRIIQNQHVALLTAKRKFQRGEKGPKHTKVVFNGCGRAYVHEQNVRSLKEASRPSQNLNNQLCTIV